MAELLTTDGKNVLNVTLIDPATGLSYAAGGGGGGGGGGGSTIDRELVVSTYVCKNAFAGSSVGDTITATQIIDVTASPTTVSTIWRNQTTALDLAGAPSASSLDLVGSTALTDAQLRASPLSLPTGAATEAKQDVMNTSFGLPADAAASSDAGTFALIPLVKRLLSKIPVIGTQTSVNSQSVTPASDAVFPINPIPQSYWRTTFAKTLTNTVDSDYFNLISTGAGHTVNQTGGNLVLTLGTTNQSETIIRGKIPYISDHSMKWSAIMSQRLAANSFIVELVDLIGDNINFTMTSATTLVATIPANPFTAENVGQSMTIGKITGIATYQSAEYAIAAVSGNDVTFTVAGFTASGSGTCSLFGWNAVRVLYTGTVATVATLSTKRKGFSTGSSFAATISTTATGHIGNVIVENNECTLYNSLQVAAASITKGVVGQIQQCIPAEVPLYLQIRAVNTAAPATSTTVTVGFVEHEQRESGNVNLNNVSPFAGNPLPVSVTGALSSVTTLTTLTTLTTMTTGNVQNIINTLVADVASAAITTTTTTSTIVPTMGVSYEINIPVTAVSGTNPTLDVVVQESDDSAVNWRDIYHFPRINAVGIYRSPILPMTGNRLRYVQTIGGTTPSLTRTINRLQSNLPSTLFYQFYDRSINPNTLNSTTPVYAINGASNLAIVVNMGAITTTAPVISLEGAESLAFSEPYQIGSDISVTANSTVFIQAQNILAGFVRLKIKTAGVGAALGYIALKAKV